MYDATLKLRLLPVLAHLPNFLPILKIIFPKWARTYIFSENVLEEFLDNLRVIVDVSLIMIIRATMLLIIITITIVIKLIVNNFMWSIYLYTVFIYNFPRIFDLTFSRNQSRNTRPS